MLQKETGGTVPVWVINQVFFQRLLSNGHKSIPAVHLLPLRVIASASISPSPLHPLQSHQPSACPVTTFMSVGCGLPLFLLPGGSVFNSLCPICSDYLRLSSPTLSTNCSPWVVPVHRHLPSNLIQFKMICQIQLCKAFRDSTIKVSNKRSDF